MRGDQLVHGRKRGEVMFSTFLDESDYTLDEVIKEIYETIYDNCLVKASMDYNRHIHDLRSIAEALEIVRKNQTSEVKK